MEEVIQQRQRHLLGRAAVGADVQHVGGDDGAAHPHLGVVLVPQPGAIRVVLWKERMGVSDKLTHSKGPSVQLKYTQERSIGGVSKSLPQLPKCWPGRLGQLLWSQKSGAGSYT